MLPIALSIFFFFARKTRSIVKIKQIIGVVKMTIKNAYIMVKLEQAVFMRDKYSSKGDTYNVELMNAEIKQLNSQLSAR